MSSSFTSGRRNDTKVIKLCILEFMLNSLEESNIADSVIDPPLRSKIDKSSRGWSHPMFT
uniref:Uncharacterized protein n=1 Tax=Moniliophthora roreri TaxID=221103 RepID=A0A0W0FN40_MONRR